MNTCIRRISLALVAALLVGLAFSSSAEAYGGSTGKIRAFHNSPDTPAVDIWVNDEQTLEGVRYGDLSAYIDLPAGEYAIEIKVAPSSASDPAALSANVTVGRSALTVAAIGSLSGSGGNALQARVYRDRGGPWWRVLSRLRVAHTSPDAPPVDIQVQLFDRWITLIPELRFGESSSYLVLPALKYDVRAVVSGTDTVALALPDTQLPGRTAVTVWAVNMLRDLDALVTVDG